MKSIFCILVLLLLSSSMMAQETGQNNLDFYISLALKDARLEQNFVPLSDEDEKDFWKDQFRFEKELFSNNPNAYQAYLNGKHIAYARHQKKCEAACHHSELYFRQASYYAVKGNFSLNSNTVISSENTLRIKTVKVPE